LSRDLNTLLGTTLAGRFELRRVLGQGGYGAVFEAEQISMGRRCAVKVLAPRDGVDRKNTARFEMEARATSKLSHPNTITIFDYGEDAEAEVFFIAMEFVEGEDLSNILRSGPMAVNDALHILGQAAASLDDAHSHGIIHRDVKPQNIMICPRTGDTLNLKVIDFGIAKALGKADLTPNTALTITGTIVGTPQYMSPEQVRDITLDGRSDQYSLAICAYTMLCGRPPFLGTSPIDIATKHLTDIPLPVSVLQPTLDLSPRFDDALLKALSKEPGDRYATCVEFVAALKAQAGDRPSARGEMVTQKAGQITPELTTEPMAEGPSPETVLAMSPDSIPQTQPAVRVPSVLPDEPGHTRALVGAQVESLGSTSSPTELDAPVREIVGTEPISEPEGRRSGVWLGGFAVGIAMVVSFFVFSDGGSPDPAAVAAPETAKPVRLADPVSARVQRLKKSAPVVEVDLVDVAESVEVVESPVLVPVETKTAPEKTVSSSKEPIVASAATKKADSKPQPDPVEVQVSVTIRPWGTLFIDGHPSGESSRQIIKVREGRHTFELRQDNKSKVQKVLEVTRSQNTTVNLVAEH
jgi:serine/threonine protein kinase